MINSLKISQKGFIATERKELKKYLFLFFLLIFLINFIKTEETGKTFNIYVDVKKGIYLKAFFSFNLYINNFYML